jgi:hypothetical protein
VSGDGRGLRRPSGTLTSRRRGECPAEVAGHSSRLIVRSRPTHPDPNSNRGGWEPAGARERHIHDTRGPADSHDTKPTVRSRPPYRRRRRQCGPVAYRTRRRSPSGCVRRCLATGASRCRWSSGLTCGRGSLHQLHVRAVPDQRRGVEVPEVMGVTGLPSQLAKGLRTPSTARSFAH